MSHSSTAGGTPPRTRSRHPHLTRTRVFVAVLMLAVTTQAGAAPGADAEAGVLPDLTCTVNFQFNFTPALQGSTTTADVDVNSGFVNCGSPNGEHPDLASGVVTGTAAATSLGGVPCSLLLTVEGTATIEWNTGDVSEGDFVVNTNPLAGTITLSAVITSGPLVGDTVTAVPVLANPNLDCLLVGLTSLTSALTVIVIE